jgi:uncharacterized protein YciI
MKQFFAVIRTRGPAWQDGLALEQQEGWDAHASFMNALESEGFVVLGGPLLGTHDALIIVLAESPEEVSERLSADPWVKMELLPTARIAPWEIRLGSLP